MVLRFAPPRLRPVAPPAAPVEALLLGRPAEAAAALLPRLFNLCRAAQETAGRMALGLPVPDDAAETLAREILRDHLLRLLAVWPGRLGLATRLMPADWAEGGPGLRRTLYGPAGRCPAGGAAFADFLAAGEGVAPVLVAIAQAFAAGEAVVEGLPAPTAATAFAPQPLENSVAARQARHPAMRAIEAQAGRGPLWRAAARLFDAAACLEGRLPPAERVGEGRALVPAARGLYAVSARVVRGRVAAFARVTPTDHLLAPGGVMERSLAALDPGAGRAALLMDILDPCVPVGLTEARHA